MYIVVFLTRIIMTYTLKLHLHFHVFNFSTVMADFCSCGRPDSTISASLSKSGQLAVASLCSGCYLLQSDHNMGAGHTGTALLGIHKHTLKSS